MMAVRRLAIRLSGVIRIRGVAKPREQPALLGLDLVVQADLFEALVRRGVGPVDALLVQRGAGEEGAAGVEGLARLRVEVGDGGAGGYVLCWA